MASRRATAAAALLLSLLLSLWITRVTVHATPSLPAISAPEAIVVDAWNGNVLFERNPDAPRAPASTVKIMTAFLTLQQRVPLQKVVTISPLAASYSGSTAGLYTGEKITVWNLLHGMLMPSGNDAAIALSEAVGGSVQHFVALMNGEAARLHMWHTRYLTANGFDAWGQVTTARDLATITRLAMARHAFARVVRTRYWSAWSADRRYFHQWTSLNHLLWSSRAIDGVKTGTTSYAGACLVSSAHRDGKWVIAINLGSSYSNRFTDGAALLNYGLETEGELPTTR